MSSILANLTVSETMSVIPYPTFPENTVADAYNLMRKKHLGGLPVVENGNLIGIITRKDVKKLDYKKAEKTKVKEVMTKKVITIMPHKKVSVALQKMTDLGVMRLPVVSQTGSLVGVLTLTDIDRARKILESKKTGKTSI